jgi:hypothetical protein
MQTSRSVKRRGVFPALFLGLDERATQPENEINERERLVCMTKNDIIFSPINEFYETYLYAF